MSKRFGRNQRRRAREALAAAQSSIQKLGDAYGRERASLREAEAENRVLQAMLEDFSREVGQYALNIGLPTEFEVDWLERRHVHAFKLPAYQPLRPIFGPRSMQTTDSIHAETMRILEVEAVRAHFSHRMEVRLTFDGVPIGYAISDAALLDLPRNRLIQKMANEMAHLLVHELGQKVRHHGHHGKHP